MPDTFSQIYIHIIFAVKGRQNQILPDWKDELYKYITGIVTNKKQKLIYINGMPNHIHILVGFRPNMNASDLVRDIKYNSTNFINSKKYLKGKFYWQEGFGAFSCSHSQLDKVINYIKNQEVHHRKKTFKEEYLDFLKIYDIEYKPEYLFDFED
jgi:putative transposase